LSKFLPKKYSIGSGIVIDRNGNNSRQTDIIIYDSLYQPSLFSQISSVLFPVDFVYMTIEVKTSLDIGFMRGAIENIASVKRLNYIDERVSYFDYDASNDKTTSMSKTTSPPWGVILGLKSTTTSLDTYESWLSPLKDMEAKYRPDTIYSIDTTFLHNYEDLRSKSKMEELYYPLLDESKFPDLEEVKVEGSGKVYKSPYDGQTYPVIEKHNKFHVVDPGKGFLNFLIIMNKSLASKKLLKRDIALDYLSKQYHLAWLEEDFSID
jgi:hypothetical protein